jgi:hypothetical protein
VGVGVLLVREFRLEVGGFVVLVKIRGPPSISLSKV